MLGLLLHIHGKGLTHDPDRAPLVTKAFDEFATGRFTKEEVLQTGAGTCAVASDPLRPAVSLRPACVLTPPVERPRR